MIYSDLNFPLDGGGEPVVGSAVASSVHEPVQIVGTFFEPSEDYLLTRVSVGVSIDPLPPIPGTNPIFDVWLYSDDYRCIQIGNRFYCGHNLGSPIAEISQNLAAVSPIPYPTLVNSGPALSPITIDAGVTYWIALTPANPYTDVYWNETSPGPTPGGGPNGLEVDGTLITPEPAAIGLFGLGLLGIPAVVKLRRRCTP